METLISLTSVGEIVWANRKDSGPLFNHLLVTCSPKGLQLIAGNRSVCASGALTRFGTAVLITKPLFRFPSTQLEGHSSKPAVCSQACFFQVFRPVLTRLSRHNPPFIPCLKVRWCSIMCVCVCVSAHHGTHLDLWKARWQTLVRCNWQVAAVCSSHRSEVWRHTRGPWIHNVSVPY